MSATSGSNSAGGGITGGYDGTSRTLYMVIASFVGLSWYNALELNVLVFVTFNRYKGLYFWSLLVASWGIIPYALGFLLKFFQITRHDYLSVSFITIGWYAMVTGQSVVLYSRLHLILQNQKILRRILLMIVVDAIILHIPTTILTFGSNSQTDVPQFVHGYNIMEKIQMTGFCVQEFIISGFYVRETTRILKMSLQRQKRKTMYQLLGINVIIILMDLGLLGVEYANLYVIETTLKGVVYSIKLKLEFAVLGKLVEFVTASSPTKSMTAIEGNANIPDFVDPSRAASDVTHAPAPPRKPSRPPWMDDDDVSIAMFEHVERKSNEVPYLNPEAPRSLSGDTQTEAHVSNKEPGMTASRTSSEVEMTPQKVDFMTSALSSEYKLGRA